jgi:hypothetical protein
MVRAKKDIDREIAEVVKTLPTQKKTEVLDFAKKLSLPKKRGTKPKTKKGPGALFWERLLTKGLYEGDGTHYDHDRMYDEML